MRLKYTTLEDETRMDKSSILLLVLRFFDVVSVLLGGVFAYYIYWGNVHYPTFYVLSFLLSSLLALILFPYMGMYKSIRGKNPLYLIQMITSAWGSVLVALIVISVFLKTTAAYSRIWFSLWAIITFFILVVYRSIVRKILIIARSKGWNRKRVVIYGAGNLGREILSRVSEVIEIGYDVVAFFDDNKELHNKDCDGVKVLGGSDDLEKYIKENSIDELWIALPFRAEKQIKELLLKVKNSLIQVRFVPDIFGLRIFNYSISDIAGISVWDLNKTPMIGVNRVIKAIEDRVLSLFILIVISPVMLFIAIAIKLESKGPVFFKQIRPGWDGKKIKVYKFRSMCVHTELPGKTTQAVKNDRRVTRIGRFIRRSSLDELPQFINVLQGKMSIVGPRPHLMEQDDYFKEHINLYMQRLKVKPGITGWAQVNGWRGETDTLYKMEKRIEHDLYYIENWSLWFDIKIILASVFKGFFNENAY